MAATAIPAPIAMETGDEDHAARLRTLQELLEAGLVSQSEFDPKRAAIIDSI